MHQHRDRGREHHRRRQRDQEAGRGDALAGGGNAHFSRPTTGKRNPAKTIIGIIRMNVVAVRSAIVRAYQSAYRSTGRTARMPPRRSSSFLAARCRRSTAARRAAPGQATRSGELRQAHRRRVLIRGEERREDHQHDAPNSWVESLRKRPRVLQQHPESSAEHRDVRPHPCRPPPLSYRRAMISSIGGFSMNRSWTAWRADQLGHDAAAFRPSNVNIARLPQPLHHAAASRPATPSPGRLHLTAARA